MTLVIDGKTLNLGSVYVPVNPGERRQFRTDLVKSPAINKYSILQGDWNCVEETSVDAQYLDGSPSGDYKNIHGGLLVTAMRNLGLADPLRLLHGPRHKDHTRRGKTVWTRLDRFYAPELNSEWRWTKVEAHPTFLRDLEAPSDHLAVIANLEWAKDRKPTKADRRIDPRILRVQEVRDEVESMWRNIYILYPPEKYGEGETLHRAKSYVA